MRRRLILVCLFGGFVAGLAASSKCAAREPFAEFVRGLQKRGYGEQALEYLDQIANRSDLPADVKEALDLERSKSLRIAANEAYDARQREARLAESKRLAEKLRQIRLALGLSQTEMLMRLEAEEVIEYNRISDYETGTGEPTLLILLQYARVANVYVEALIDDELELPTPAADSKAQLTG